MKVKKLVILILAVFALLCNATAFSACGGNENAGNELISISFADEDNCPNGNIKDEYLKSAMDFELNKTYYIVIDYTYIAEREGNGTDNLCADVSIMPASNVSATLEETASGNFSEQVTDDEMNINVSYSVPEKAGEEKAIRIVVRVVPLQQEITYVKASFYLNNVDSVYLCSKGFTVCSNFVNNIEFTLNSDGSSYSVASYDSTVIEKTVIIPSTYNGLRVTGINKSAFRNCSGLTNIIIPDSITIIGYGAFSNCSGLTNITIPDSVVDIDGSAFYKCSGLKNVNLSKNLTRIGHAAFAYCNNLTSINIPEGVTEIINDTFSSCRSLARITFCKNITFIGDSAFGGCNSLKSVYYYGTAGDWSKINIRGDNNFNLAEAVRYFYSETKPAESGNYWHYENGEPAVW